MGGPWIYPSILPTTPLAPAIVLSPPSSSNSTQPPLPPPSRNHFDYHAPVVDPPSLPEIRLPLVKCRREAAVVGGGRGRSSPPPPTCSCPTSTVTHSFPLSSQAQEDRTATGPVIEGDFRHQRRLGNGTRFMNEGMAAMAARGAGGAGGRWLEGESEVMQGSKTWLNSTKNSAKWNIIKLLNGLVV